VLGYAISRTTGLDFEEAVARLRAALAAEDFVVTFEIDVQKTVRERFGEGREPYVLLAASNPPLGQQGHATGLEPGVLLPCNVAVYVEAGETRVAVVDTAALLGVAGHPELDEALADVRERLARALATAA
jgi:uncharacterized protein (DUF302 family)